MMESQLEHTTLDAHASNGKVLVRGGNLVGSHLWLLYLDGLCPEMGNECDGEKKRD
jgi:hypothetical protein